MVRILISFSLMLSALVVCSARHGKHQDIRQRQMYPVRPLDFNDNTTPQDEWAEDKNSCAKSGQVLEVENLINNSVNILLHRLDKLGHKPEKAQRSNNFPWESVLRKELNDLRQEMMQCCANGKGLESKIITEIESVIPSISKQKNEPKNEINQIVKKVSRVVDKGQKKLDKLLDEWDVAIAGFQASQQKFKIDMELQAKKYSDLKNCVVNARIKKIKNEIEDKTYEITETPIPD